MEIEKTRETSWRIQLKNRNDNIEITSVEISGEVRIIKLALLRDEKSIKVQMNKEEFYNFLSLISAFKDVVIGESSLLNEEQFNISMTNEEDSENISYFNSESSEKTYQNSQKEDLNPKDWDPW